MLGMALLVFALRQVSTDAHWSKIERYVKISFWGLNIGLAGMVILQLFPSGILQFLDVINNGYWHARSTAFGDSPTALALAWARLPTDLVFIIVGVLLLLYAARMTYLRERKPA